MRITFKIKLLNRIPLKIDGYKRGMKLPVHLRSNDSDHLNNWVKQSDEIQEYSSSIAWSTEITRLKEVLDWRLGKNPEFGEMLIGYISVVEFDDFYIEIYQRIRDVKLNK